MTREEARGNLIHAIRWNDMPKKEALEVAIEALSSSEKPNKWIPVNQPPKASGRYIVTTRFLKHSQIEIADYATDLHKVDEYDFPKHEAGWYNYDSEYGHYAIDNVIAWMPLPKPYKASPTGAEGSDKE